MNPAPRVFLVEGSRSPILKARGSRGPFSAADLATAAGKPLLNRLNIDPTKIDEVILGCVMPSEREANIARIVALRLGLGERMPAWTVQRNCASGMQSIDSAMNRIQLGLADLVLAGGVESMSHAPVLFSTSYVNWLGGTFAAKSMMQKFKAMSAFRPGFLKPVIGLEHGLTDPVVGLSMGQTAEKIAHRFNISREAMDAYAVRSHLRAAAAQAQGHFGAELVPLYDRDGRIYQQDEGVRPDSSQEKLATLKPVFDKPFGKVTAANSSQISDGAAWTLLASERAVERYGLEPLAEIKAVRWAALDPSEMGLGPAHAGAKLLKEYNLSLADIDYWELNEAFAAQVLACLAAFEDADYCRQELGFPDAIGRIDEERLNLDGGAVACGHPVGMSGARIVLHLAHVLRRLGAKRGIATLCIGGGQGGAALIESMGKAQATPAQTEPPTPQQAEPRQHEIQQGQPGSTEASN